MASWSGKEFQPGNSGESSAPNYNDNMQSSNGYGYQQNYYEPQNWDPAYYQGYAPSNGYAPYVDPNVYYNQTNMYHNPYHNGYVDYAPVNSYYGESAPAAAYEAPTAQRYGEGYQGRERGAPSSRVSSRPAFHNLDNSSRANTRTDNNARAERSSSSANKPERIDSSKRTSKTARYNDEAAGGSSVEQNENSARPTSRNSNHTNKDSQRNAPGSYNGPRPRNSALSWRERNADQYRNSEEHRRDNYQRGRSDNGPQPRSYAADKYYGQKHYSSSNGRYDSNYKSDQRGTPTKEYKKFSSRPQPFHNKFHLDNEDDSSHRERLSSQLSSGTYECMVCCDRIGQKDPIWNCNLCYHVFHLRCIKKWAQSSATDFGWRCPGCQNVTEKQPESYRCFCGKQRDPEWNRRDVPHSCGDVCKRQISEYCIHPCTLPCHPGPCPPCGAMVKRSCACGKSSQTVLCGKKNDYLCGETCSKMLNCHVHKCQLDCHQGECQDCDVQLEQECHCKKATRSVSCAVESNAAKAVYSCGDLCDGLLSCCRHKCRDVCHEGPCNECPLLPENVVVCCCGQTTLKDIKVCQERTKCTDQIPTCDKVCKKPLNCGSFGNGDSGHVNPHTCHALCHDGDCPPCQLNTKVRCRCGAITRDIRCVEYLKRTEELVCERKCQKKRTCGRHKCGLKCCVDREHRCSLVCGRQLKCRLHTCDEPCHQGNCPNCWRTSFDEWACLCGVTVIYPPIPCGTPPPECSQVCKREHPCDHPVMHSCHNEERCPPCSVLTSRYCFGEHELRKSIPCHQTEISCGLPCNKELKCGRHRCIQKCHGGSCVNDVCRQPCPMPRAQCQHPCGVKCHDGSCPSSQCKATVKVTCKCGNLSATRSCAENEKEYRKMTNGMVLPKPLIANTGYSLDSLTDSNSAWAKAAKLKTLECNEECALIERNTRLALALQICNPELTGKPGPPSYSQYLKDRTKKDQVFAQFVHDKLTALVTLAKDSKQKNRSHSFEPMNREKRQFVHEYCEHFGCESQAYDAEPKRNIIATAYKEKSYLPSISVVEVVRRESGHRKVPGPVISSATSKAAESSARVMMQAPKSNPWCNKSNPSVSKPPSSAPSTSQTINYFDL